MEKTKVLNSIFRGYIWDLLPTTQPRSNSEIVVFVCQLLGCATVVAIAALSIQHAGTISASQVVPLAVFVTTVALLIGNLIKEVAILIGSIAINRLGVEFRRIRLTLNGAQMNEVYRPDGTWDRYILETAEIIHEWLDLNGECHRETLDCGGPADFRELNRVVPNRKTS